MKSDILSKDIELFEQMLNKGQLYPIPKITILRCTNDCGYIRQYMYNIVSLYTERMFYNAFVELTGCINKYRIIIEGLNDLNYQNIDKNSKIFQSILDSEDNTAASLSVISGGWFEADPAKTVDGIVFERFFDKNIMQFEECHRDMPHLRVVIENIEKLPFKQLNPNG